MNTNNNNNNGFMFILLVVVVLVSIGGNGGVIAMNNKKCIDRERHALLDFKANIQDPEGSLSGWGVEEERDCCKWRGVTCNNQTGHVTRLYLKYGGLEGEISHALLNLTYLSSLDLSDNYLNGTIPLSIGSLTELRELYLSSNLFYGTIPTSIGSLTELRYLDLSYNALDGTIPVLLTELRSLHLSYNYFTGTIPMSIGSLTKLRSLNLSFNYFTGTIPSEFGNLVNLEHLSLGGKFESLAIENLDWLYHMSQLQSLKINSISLAKVDNWVNVILSLYKLYDLKLSNCDLSRVMHPYSSSLNSSVSSNIVSLNLENNNLNSSMYDWLFPLTTNSSLRELDLSGNMLDGIPAYIGNLSSLRILYLYNNSVAVNFFDFLCNLPAYTLHYLVASNSRFTSSFYDIQRFSNNSLLEGSSIEVIDLSSSKLLGPRFPKWIQNLKNLTTLDIGNTGISDAIPMEFWNMWPYRLRYLNLSSNNIVGQVTKLNPSLSTIDLSSNNFHGLIPIVPANLYSLNLSRNKFYGGISFLCKILYVGFQYLDLSHNLFSGQLPDCLWHFKDLIVLNLGNNQLSGRIPRSLESLIQLEVLNLYNNTFSGELPLSLKNCTMLNFLDLGENNFSGNLPVWIGENLSRLYALSLKSNNFFGPIPLQLCQLVHLQILDLSLNNLYGTIPSCLNNLTSMIQKDFFSSQNRHDYQFWSGGYEYVNTFVDHSIIQWQGNIREFSSNLQLLKSIDISGNNLTGKIPYELTDLLGLVALNLSKNSLIGEIPQSVGQMKELLSLDLSRNCFSGKIPSSVSHMPSLSYLDVSYNNLYGRVPTGSQLQTFKPSWFTGNVGLCGLPATKHCPGDEDLPIQPAIVESEDGGEVEDDLERWYYIGGASGFATGFWIVCSALLLNRRGRHAFFNFLDNSRDWVYVKVTVLIAKSGARAGLFSSM